MTNDYHANPVHTYFEPGTETQKQGELCLKEAKVGAIILAGGHGSRLGYDAPKGCFPITKDNKSLYELFAEKTRSVKERYGVLLPLAFMTSDATHEQTVEHFKKANFFGLEPSQVFFFKQGNLPLEDDMGRKMQTQAPDGNGAIFWHFAKSNIHWEGIEQVVVCTVDNALADPFQLDLIGLTHMHNNDVTVVGIKRENPEEHVGVLVEQNEKLAVVEYSEMPDSERLAEVNGVLKYPLANISYFSFSMPFIKRVQKKSSKDLPLHKARKKIDGKYFYKSEYFIFDLLAFANKSEVLLLPRKSYFAPLKNREGPHSPETVRQALETR